MLARISSARPPSSGASPSDAAKKNIDRIFEIWTSCLERSGGPFLFGQPTIPDFFFYPVLTRFHTYGIELPEALRPYVDAVDAHPAVVSLMQLAATEPRIQLYDDYLSGLGGDPNATLRNPA